MGQIWSWCSIYVWDDDQSLWTGGNIFVDLDESGAMTDDEPPIPSLSACRGGPAISLIITEEPGKCDGKPSSVKNRSGRGFLIKAQQRPARQQNGL